MPQSIDQILEDTLADYRLSRSERRAMKMVLEGMHLDDDRLAHVRHRAFLLARAQLVDPQAHRVLDWLEAIFKALLPEPTRVPTCSRAYFRPGDDCVRRVCRLIQTARRKIDVCVFTITDDRIAGALLAAHTGAVAVRIVTDDDKAKDLGSDVGRFESAGIPVRFDHSDRLMHHKFAVFDDTQLLTGSYNWTRDASKNMENMIVTPDKQLVRAFSTVFEQLWGSLPG